MSTSIEIIKHSDRVETLLAPYKDVIGQDFNGYRNHVYRTVTYAMHFLGNDEIYRALVETAFVYHDIGLWTDKELAYLEPSETIALRDNEEKALGLDPEMLKAAIHWHHKISPYTGNGAAVVNAVRKADWIDATQGKFRKGMSRDQIAAVEAAIPNEAFHDTLGRLAGELGGSALRGNLRVLRRVFKW